MNPETSNIVFEVWTFKSKILQEVKKTSSSQGFPSWLLHREGPNVTMLRLSLQPVFSLKIEKSRSGTITRDKTSGHPWGLLVWQLLAFGFFQSGFPLSSHSNTEEVMSPSQSFILLFLLSSFFEWISLDSPRFCFFFFLNPYPLTYSCFHTNWTLDVKFFPPWTSPSAQVFDENALLNLSHCLKPSQRQQRRFWTRNEKGQEHTEIK